MFIFGKHYELMIITIDIPRSNLVPYDLRQKKYMAYIAIIVHKSRDLIIGPENESKKLLVHILG